MYLIESNRWGTEAGIHFTQEQGTLLLTLLDCIVLFIMWQSQHVEGKVEGKAKASGTSSHSHKIEKGTRVDTRQSCLVLPPSPSHRSCPSTWTWCGGLTSLPAGTSRVLHSFWANPKDQLYQTHSACPILCCVQVVHCKPHLQQPWSHPAQLSSNFITKG